MVAGLGAGTEPADERGDVGVDGEHPAGAAELGPARDGVDDPLDGPYEGRGVRHHADVLGHHGGGAGGGRGESGRPGGGVEAVVDVDDVGVAGPAQGCGQQGRREQREGDARPALHHVGRGDAYDADAVLVVDPGVVAAGEDGDLGAVPGEVERLVADDVLDAAQVRRVVVADEQDPGPAPDVVHR